MSDTSHIESVESTGSLQELCYRIRRSLDFNHAHCPQAERTGLSRQLLEPGSLALSILGREFGRVIVFDAKQGVGPDGGFDLLTFLRYVSHRMADVFGLEMDTSRFHPEQVSQILKDETESTLFCFVDIQIIPYDALQRLRDFTQSQECHRCLFCGPHDFGRSESPSSAPLQLQKDVLVDKLSGEDSEVLLELERDDEDGDDWFSLENSSILDDDDDLLPGASKHFASDSGLSLVMESFEVESSQELSAAHTAPSDSGLSLVMESFDEESPEEISTVRIEPDVALAVRHLSDSKFLESPCFESEEERLAAALHYASALLSRGESTAALDWLQAIHQSESSSSRDAARALSTLLADALVATADWPKALEVLQRQEQDLQQSEQIALLVQCLQRQARILMQHGQIDRAAALLQRQEQLCHQLGDALPLVEALTSQAEICSMLGDLTGSLAILARAERVCRLNGLHENVVQCLGRRATALRRAGSSEQALDVLREQYRVSVSTGLYETAAVALGNQAAIWESHGNLPKAFDLYQQGEALCRKSGKGGILARNLANQAFFLSTKMGRHDDALTKATDALSIAKKVGPPSLVEQIGALIGKIRDRDR